MTKDEQENLDLFKGTELFSLLSQLKVPLEEQPSLLNCWVDGITMLSSSGFFLALEKKTKIAAMEQFLNLETPNADCEIIRVQSFVHAMKTFASYGEEIKIVLKGENQ